MMTKFATLSFYTQVDREPAIPTNICLICQNYTMWGVTVSENPKSLHWCGIHYHCQNIIL